MKITEITFYPIQSESEPDGSFYVAGEQKYISPGIALIEHELFARLHRAYLVKLDGNKHSIGDTLVYVENKGKLSRLVMTIDDPERQCPVAAYQTEWEKVLVTPLYEGREDINKLEPYQIMEVFQEVLKRSSRPMPIREVRFKNLGLAEDLSIEQMN